MILPHQHTFIKQMLFYPKIPTIKASFHVAVIQRKSRFFRMNILEHKKEKENRMKTKDRMEERRAGGREGKIQERREGGRGREGENRTKCVVAQSPECPRTLWLTLHHPCRKRLRGEDATAELVLSSKGWLFIAAA